MKFTNFVLNSAIFTTALFFGLVWVGAYQLLLGASATSVESKSSHCVYKTKAANNFDINDPNSVLPIDFEEEKLTSPKTNESNTAYFDPEGSYYLLDEAPKGFEDFKQFNINNKKLDVDPRDKSYGDVVAPTGSILLLKDNNQGSLVRFKNLEISDGKLMFEAQSNNGVSYEFDGEFAVKGNFYTLDQDAEVVKGVLIRKENGETVAESRVDFGWELNY